MMSRKTGWMSCVLENVSVIIPLAPDETAQEILLEDLKGCGAEVILSSEGSRAKSLNRGAAKARNEFLWFLHADTRVDEGNIKSLAQSLKDMPEGLHYFDLKFDAMGLVQLNAWGANMRSRLFGLPYGDQGLCLSKSNFDAAGAFCERVSYGEDLLFVRRVKRHGITLCPVPSALLTSARKYKACGYFRLTFLRQWQLLKLLREKI